MGKGDASDYEIRERAAWIRMDCPENRNALSTTLLGELSRHLQTAMADPGVRVVVLTGSSSVFCSGADLKSRGSGVADGASDNAFVEILKRMREGPKPVICAVQLSDLAKTQLLFPINSTRIRSNSCAFGSLSSASRSVMTLVPVSDRHLPHRTYSLCSLRGTMALPHAVPLL